MSSFYSSSLSWSWMLLQNTIGFVFFICLLNAVQLEGASVWSQPMASSNVDSAEPAPVPLSALVPFISNFHYSVQPLQDNQYQLFVRYADGGLRKELVELRPVSADDATLALHLKGELTNVYPKEGGILLVIYEAGPQGYVAKVKYEAGKPVLQPIQPQFASSTFLKTAAG